MLLELTHLRAASLALVAVVAVGCAGLKNPFASLKAAPAADSVATSPQLSCGKIPAPKSAGYDPVLPNYIACLGSTRPKLYVASVCALGEAKAQLVPGMEVAVTGANQTSLLVRVTDGQTGAADPTCFSRSPLHLAFTAPPKDVSADAALQGLLKGLFEDTAPLGLDNYETHRALKFKAPQFAEPAFHESELRQKRVKEWTDLAFKLAYEGAGDQAVLLHDPKYAWLSAWPEEAVQAVTTGLKRGMLREKARKAVDCMQRAPDVDALVSNLWRLDEQTASVEDDVKSIPEAERDEARQAELGELNARRREIERQLTGAVDGLRSCRASVKF